MRVALVPHPDTTSDAIEAIEADLSWAMRPGQPASRRWLLRYFVTGAVGRIRLPLTKKPARADALWRHTCFEAFIRFGPAGPYREFNFAPTGEWAAYDFISYRGGMRPAEMEAPLIDTGTRESRFELQVFLPPDAVAGPRAVTHVGLSAVIEETDGRMSYWALAHPDGKPDFHHPDCFALELPPASHA
jgi:hypothetical protein